MRKIICPAVLWSMVLATAIWADERRVEYVDPLSLIENQKLPEMSTNAAIQHLETVFSGAGGGKQASGKWFTPVTEDSFGPKISILNEHPILGHYSSRMEIGDEFFLWRQVLTLSVTKDAEWVDKQNVHHVDGGFRWINLSYVKDGKEHVMTKSFHVNQAEELAKYLQALLVLSRLDVKEGNILKSRDENQRRNDSFSMNRRGKLW